MCTEVAEWARGRVLAAKGAVQSTCSLSERHPLSHPPNKKSRPPNPSASAEEISTVNSPLLSPSTLLIAMALRLGTPHLCLQAGSRSAASICLSPRRCQTPRLDPAASARDDFTLPSVGHRAFAFVTDAALHSARPVSSYDCFSFSQAQTCANTRHRCSFPDRTRP